MKGWRGWGMLALLLCWSQGGEAATVEVAAAANVGAALKEIGAVFQRDTGHQANVTLGATGKLYAQIHNGAPFQVFLAADDATPAKLEQEGLGVAGSRFTYAVGRLVLWSPKPGVVDGEGKVLTRNGFHFLSVANPKLAPYGAAAQEVLQGMKLWDALQPRIVLGENITQAHQFIQSGNAELGFVALSQVREKSGEIPGSSWLVPVDRHAPLRQGAVLLAAGRDNPAATAFLDFLRGAAARAVLAGYGYEEAGD